MTDWMLHYAERRTVQREAENAIDDHFEKMMNGEETEYGTMWDAARAAALEQMADFKED